MTEKTVSMLLRPVLIWIRVVLAVVGDKDFCRCGHHRDHHEHLHHHTYCATCGPWWSSSGNACDRFQRARI